MSALYDLVNLYRRSDGHWLGQFTAEGAAKWWIAQQGLNLEDHEISNRRPTPAERSIT